LTFYRFWGRRFLLLRLLCRFARYLGQTSLLHSSTWLPASETQLNMIIESTYLVQNERRLDKFLLIKLVIICFHL
jgi:hypothetical protein